MFAIFSLNIYFQKIFYFKFLDFIVKNKLNAYFKISFAAQKVSNLFICCCRQRNVNSCKPLHFCTFSDLKDKEKDKSSIRSLKYA